MQHGADVTAVDVNDATPLQLSAYHCHINCIRALVDTYRAPVNGVVRLAATPLHGAAYDGNMDVVQLLTSYSECDVSLKDAEGQTAADVARSQGHDDIAEYLTSWQLLMTKQQQQRQASSVNLM